MILLSHLHERVEAAGWQHKTVLIPVKQAADNRASLAVRTSFHHYYPPGTPDSRFFPAESVYREKLAWPRSR